MLIFTNRELQAGTDASAFTRRFQPGADTLAAAQVDRSGGGFVLSDAQAALGDDAAVERLVPLFRGPRRVLVYLHGNNNSPSDCFERCARLAEIYGLEVVGFSWPSEGFLSSGEDLPNLPPGDDDEDDTERALDGITTRNRREGWADRKMRRYRQAKTNAQESGDALARFLRLLATARLYANQQPMTIAAHSLGCHFLQYTIETETAAESLAAAHNIALLAACCRAEGHGSWVGRLHPRGQVFLVYNRGDTVLWGASIADGGPPKLGADPGATLAAPGLRYVSFTNGEVGLWGHACFVRDAGHDVPRIPKKLFGRIFGSERDFREDQGEYPRQVYPVGCDEDRVTCYMGRPSLEPSGP